MDERRSRKRWHSVLKGQIVSLNRTSLIECTVRDLSDTGARICLRDTTDLPPEFQLEIPRRGLRVHSRLTWSQGTSHGVIFMEEVKAWTDPIRTVPSIQ
jgi:phage protein D